VLRAGRRQCRSHLQTLKAHFADSLTQVRQSLAAPKLISQDGDGSTSLSELLTNLVLATVEKVKSVLQDLLVSFLRRKDVCVYIYMYIGCCLTCVISCCHDGSL
jgi:hypothetical protein